MTAKACRYCGDPIPARPNGKRGPKPRYCSAAHQRQAHGRSGQARVCAWCGGHVSTTSAYCGDGCREAADLFAVLVDEMDATDARAEAERLGRSLGDDPAVISEAALMRRPPNASGASGESGHAGSRQRREPEAKAGKSWGDGPGSRKAMTNDAARRLTRHERDGGERSPDASVMLRREWRRIDRDEHRRRKEATRNAARDS